MTPQELKNSILQLAIQGKLVEQRPEEGTAEDLYQQIQVEKQRFIKAGKMKKEKQSPQIMDDDIPFDIPASWKWVRITELGEVIGGGTPKTANADYWDDAGIPWLTPADMKFIIGKYAERGERNISAIGLEKSSAQLMPKGTVLYSSRAPIGYIAIAANDISTNQGFKSLVPAIMDVNEFIYYCLMSRTSDIVSRASGTTFKEISGTDFGLTIVPIPPLAEQKRIVAKIEELLPYIDRYEQAWSKLEDFNKRFSTDMQKSILQMAIQGKLVEQLPEEGTGEELYQQIQAEKQRLLKAGVIKKEKPLPEITEDEKPFDIPDSWKWVRIGHVFSLQAGKNITASDIFEEPSPEHPFLCYGGNGIRGYVSSNNRSGHYALIGRQGALCGNINFANGDFYATEHAVVVDHFQMCDVLWSGYTLRALNLNQYATATAQPGLAVSNIVNVLIPLPPLAEQKRIVAKLEEILPLCEKLK